MASLTPASAAALARLRSYVPPPTTWYSVPVSRRAAVLILLFADRKGDLRVVLTMRAATLKSYAGQAALPGGKTDTILETPLQTARREASEEIGLPEPVYPQSLQSEIPVSADPSSSVPADHPHSTKFNPPTTNLPSPFQIEHLCQLPSNLARTELVVRPCVAFLRSTPTADAVTADVETSLIPRLDPKEVAAVFSGPLHNFLGERDEEELAPGVLGEWYKGTWMDWQETQWRMHNFFVPVKGHAVTRPEKPKRRRRGTALAATPALQDPGSAPGALQTSDSYPPASATIPYRDIPRPYDDANPDPLDTLTRFRVFGMTARILVDCARIAFGHEPEFEHNHHFGDEEMIQRLIQAGKLDTERFRGAEFNGEDLIKAMRGKGFGGLIRDDSASPKI